MTILDLFFLFLFIGAVALGFFQGLVRISAAILAFYLSLVLASLYFPVVADIFVQNFNAARYVGEYVGFALILLISFFILFAAGLYTFRNVELPGSLIYVDRTIGVVLSMFFGTVMIGIFAALFWNLMIVRGAETINFPLMGWLGSQTRQSFLIGYFSRQVLPLLYGYIDPILPDAAEIIFSV